MCLIGHSGTLVADNSVLYFLSQASCNPQSGFANISESTDPISEVEGKDTKADEVLKVTYVPKLCTFEQEIMETHGIKEDREPKPTYWY